MGSAQKKHSCRTKCRCFQKGKKKAGEQKREQDACAKADQRDPQELAQVNMTHKTFSSLVGFLFSICKLRVLCDREGFFCGGSHIL